MSSYSDPSGSDPRSGRSLGTDLDPRGKAIGAVIMGGLAILSFWIPLINALTLALSVLGIVFAIQAIGGSAPGSSTHGLAILGLVLSIIGCCLDVPGLLCTCVAGGVSCLVPFTYY